MTDFEKRVEALGISLESLQKKSTIEELRGFTPGMINTISKETFQFSINYGNMIEWSKNTGRILSLYLFFNMEKDKKGKARLKPSPVTFKQLYKPYQGQDLSGKNILIWRTGGFGDLCFINPSMRYMKKKWPDCKIYFSCSPTYVPLVEKWDCIDQIVEFPVLTDYLRKCHYHATFEGVIERCEEAEKENAYLLFSRWLGLDIPIEDLRPQFDTDPECDLFADEYLKENDIKDYIVVQLRASTPIRTPSTECWSNILTPLLKDGHKVILTDSPRMYERLNAFINLAIPAQYRNQVYNFSNNSLDIKRSISLVGKARLAISPDTSMIHIAQSVGCPVLGIYGAFSGDVRMSTYINADWVEPEQSDVCKHNGKYCFLHGQKCEAVKPGSTAPCYGYINYSEAYEKATKLFKAREEGYKKNYTRRRIENV